MTIREFLRKLVKPKSKKPSWDAAPTAKPYSRTYDTLYSKPTRVSYSQASQIDNMAYLTAYQQAQAIAAISDSGCSSSYDSGSSSYDGGSSCSCD